MAVLRASLGPIEQESRNSNRSKVEPHFFLSAHSRRFDFFFFFQHPLFLENFSRCSIYYPPPARNLREDNARKHCKHCVDRSSSLPPRRYFGELKEGWTIRPLLLDLSAHTGNSDEVKAAYSSRLLTPQRRKQLQKLGAVAGWREITVFKRFGTERATLRWLCKRLRSAAEPVSKPRQHLPRRTNMHEKVPADMTTADFTSAAKRESHSRQLSPFCCENLVCSSWKFGLK